MKRSIIAFASACCVFASLSARAQDAEEAKRLFEAGLALYEMEDYAAAATQFQASIHLHPTKMGYFNWATCLRLLQRHREAVAALDALEAAFAGGIDGELQSRISSLRTELMANLAAVELRVSPNGAQIEERGQVLGRTPLLHPLVLDAGQHALTIRAPGYGARTISVVATVGTVATVEVALEAEPAAPMAPTPASPSVAQTPATTEPMPNANSASSSSRLSPLFWTGLALTVVTGALTGVMYGLAGSASQDFESARSIYESTNYETPTDEQAAWNELDDRKQTMNRLSGAGLGLAIGTGVFATVTVVAAVARSRSHSEGPVAVQPHPSGLVVCF